MTTHMQPVDRENMLSGLLSLVDVELQNFRNQNHADDAFDKVKVRWRRIFELLPQDIQVEYEETVLSAFCDYEGILENFYWTQGLLAAVQSNLKIPDIVPGLAEAERELSKSCADFVSNLNEEIVNEFHEYVRAKKNCIDESKDYSYLTGFELALALLNNIGLRTNEDFLEKLYAQLERKGKK
ncbi:hypothetical protein [uncultured Oscillibacter sp.]|uniref:hypothetical protein n=1 Tax=uncultured Oscillibacter sp. TaxID=876091 RepID=UPI00261B07CB|nr:hypothetical protein [uncultured Oscillibacter sp.]